jgi:hypothetical protein
MGGASSVYKINIDGTPGPQVNNIELEANDSLYVFVTVAINPNAANLPFVVRDSIKIDYNGNTRFLQLEAWGQNANFLRNQKITGNTIWNNTLPYVILDQLRVDTTASLTIPAGCRIYVHADAPIIIDGTLRVNGNATKGDTTRVFFQGEQQRQCVELCSGEKCIPGHYCRKTFHQRQL